MGGVKILGNCLWSFYNSYQFVNALGSQNMLESQKNPGSQNPRCLKVFQRSQDSVDSVDSVDNVDNVVNDANAANAANVDNVTNVPNIDN